jgi:hypothetical protein
LRIALRSNRHEPEPSTTAAKTLLADPPKCLKRSGLGHIRRVGSGKWQGTIGQDPTKDVNASVFVEGPYGSVKAASTAAARASLVQIAYAGGLFTVTATRASYLSQEASRRPPMPPPVSPRGLNPVVTGTKS